MSQVTQQDINDIIMPPALRSAIDQGMANRQLPISGDGAATLMGLASIRQALFDVLGAYPAANVLPYAYSWTRAAINSNAVAANDTVNTSIKITADSAFVATQVRGTSTGAYRVLPRIDSSDRVLANEAVHSNAYVGTAERPAYLPKPLLLPANTTISFDVTDLSGASNDIFFTLMGFKIYGFVN